MNVVRDAKPRIDVTFDAKGGGPEQPVRFDSLVSWSDHTDEES